MLCARQHKKFEISKDCSNCKIQRNQSEMKNTKIGFVRKNRCPRQKRAESDHLSPFSNLSHAGHSGTRGAACP